MILSDKTIRKIIVDNKEKCIDIIEKGIEDNCIVTIQKHGNVYEIDLLYKAGDYFKYR